MVMARAGELSAALGLVSGLHVAPCSSRSLCVARVLSGGLCEVCGLSCGSVCWLTRSLFISWPPCCPWFICWSLLVPGSFCVPLVNLVVSVWPLVYLTVSVWPLFYLAISV
jgi:hypothetical protein